MNSNEFNNYTQLTRAELENWFNHADKDGDGSLTMEELKEIISGEQPSTQELQSKFSLLNSSLTLTHKENRNKRRSISRSYLDIIDQLGVDADGNGTIDLEEFTQMMKLLGIYNENCKPEIAKPKQLLPVAPKRLSLQKDKPKSD